MRENSIINSTTKKSFVVVFLVTSVLLFWFYSAKATNISSDITTDDLTVESNATVGDATSTDRMYLNARVGSSIIPTANNLIDVGEFDRAWRNTFVSGTAYAGTLTVDGNTTLGNAISDTVTVNGLFASDLNPDGNGTRNIGNYGYAFTNVLASGTVYAARTRVENGSASTPAYSFAGDTNTGFFWSSSGVVAFSSDNRSNGAGVVNFGGNDVRDGLIPGGNNVNDLGSYYSSNSDSGAWRYIFASGTAYIGGASSTGGFYPAVNKNNTYDIGGYQYAWRNLFASGTAYVSSAIVGDGTSGAPSITFAQDTNTGFLRQSDDVIGVTLGGTIEFYYAGTTFFPAGSGTNDLGAFFDGETGPWGSLYASGTAYIGGASSTGGLYPALNKNNTYDIGGFQYAWRDIFASGSVYGRRMIVETGTAAAPGFAFASNTATGLIVAGSSASELSIVLNSNEFYTFSTNQIEPAGNSEHSLGKFNNAWSNLFASGTLYAASSTYYNNEATSTIYAKSAVSGRGGAIILEDSDGSGCTAINVNNGVMNAVTVTCPD